jgi:queuine/archaeosine tRNA-ribosyltransferase
MQEIRAAIEANRFAEFTLEFAARRARGVK